MNHRDELEAAQARHARAVEEVSSLAELEAWTREALVTAHRIEAECVHLVTTTDRVERSIRRVQRAREILIRVRRARFVGLGMVVTLAAAAGVTVMDPRVGVPAQWVATVVLAGEAFAWVWSVRRARAAARLEARAVSALMDRPAG